MVADGMSVLRQSSRKMKMTKITRTTAAARVKRTSSMDSRTASVVSKARLYFIPGGKRLEILSSSARAARSTSMALALERAVSPMPTASLPLNWSSVL